MDSGGTFEKRALQAAVALGCLVPIGAGLSGIILGPFLSGGAVAVPTDLDSHFRYLSGLLFAIGLGFLSTVPRIERQKGRFLGLTSIVMVGGLGRLASVLALGLPSVPMQAALAMELLVTPALCLWQRRIARRATPA